ncbi:MAG: exonuclease domain-containing protein [Thermaerobacter sp.]|nr:exonuclease domain-containing protein [Thermaerobacter sp.]
MPGKHVGWPRKWRSQIVREPECMQPWTSFVVVDCETTGLNPLADEIIQLAMRTSDGRVYQRFFNPGRPVPAEILRLTGLHEVVWSEQAHILDVVDEIADFLRESTVVGHNVAFDAAFLRRYGIALPRTVDTLEWARLAFPGRSGYALGDLVPEQAGLHDARRDVAATWTLLAKIRAELSRWGAQTRRDLAAILGPEWAWWGLGEDSGGLLSPLDAPAPERPPGERPGPLAVAIAAETWLEQRVRPTLPRFEARSAQNEMLHGVDHAMQNGRIILAEAGTGTGKSLAYLVPAVVAASRGQRVVVATHTVALQEQLWQKDLPQAVQDLALNTSLLKGRGRYVCLQKANQARADAAVLADSREQRWALARLLAFLATADAGDIDAFHPRTPEETRLWQDVVADWDACAGARCPYAGPCFMRGARRTAESAHLVVTNHALVAADLGQHRVLPAYDVLILDEAHHWAEVVERVFGTELDLHRTRTQMAEAFEYRAGLLARISAWLMGEAATESARELARQMADGLAWFSGYLLEHTPSGEGGRQSVRLTADVLSAWSDAAVRRVGDIADQAQALSLTLARVIETAEARGLDAGDPMHLRLEKWLRDSSEHSQIIKQWMEAPDTRVCWWETAWDRVGEAYVTLRSAPLDIAPLLERVLWPEVSAAVLTSATLGSEKNFGFLRQRLGLPAARVVSARWDSPFNVRQHARLMIPTDAPDVRDPAYLDALSDFVEKVAGMRRGRTLVLATSHRTVSGLAWRVREGLAAQAISTRAQGVDGSAQRLVAEFTRDPHSVLIGTLSYWEGVDIPGDGLEVVIIARLPFRSPGDPMEEAHAERLQRQGASPFYGWALPRAILRFQQGFGRLLRTVDDRGVVVVFDGRVHPGKTRYGRRFLKALPEVPVVSGAASELINHISDFFSTEHDGRDLFENPADE